MEQTTNLLPHINISCLNPESVVVRGALRKYHSSECRSSRLGGVQAACFMLLHGFLFTPEVVLQVVQFNISFINYQTQTVSGFLQDETQNKLGDAAGH